MKKLKIKLWKLFSLYIRRRDKYICFTCGKYCKDNSDAGHLISRKWLPTLFDELNVHCQCKGCNIKHNYDYEIYRNKFIKKYGQQEYDRLYLLSKKSIKLTKQWYDDKIKYYTDLLVC